MQGRANDSGQVAFGMILTAFIHAGLIAFYVTAGARESAAEVEEVIEFVTVDPIGWGEIRDPNALPEISNPAPETRPEEVVRAEEPQDVEPPEQEEPEEREVSREEQPEVPQDSSRHNPERPVNEVAPEGRPDGMRGARGVSDAQVDLWAARVLQSIQRAYRQPPGLSESQMRDLRGRVRIFLNAEGRITRYRWVERSGNRIWDESVEHTLNNFRLGNRRLELPFDNERLLEYFVEEGLNYEFRF